MHDITEEEILKEKVTVWNQLENETGFIKNKSMSIHGLYTVKASESCLLSGLSNVITCHNLVGKLSYLPNTKLVSLIISKLYFLF